MTKSKLDRWNRFVCPSLNGVDWRLHRIAPNNCPVPLLGNNQQPTSSNDFFNKKGIGNKCNQIAVRHWFRQKRKVSEWTIGAYNLGKTGKLFYVSDKNWKVNWNKSLPICFSVLLSLLNPSLFFCEVIFLRFKYLYNLL